MSKPKKSQVKHLQLRLIFSRQLLIKLRQARTKRAQRSKRYSQIVLPIYFSKYKEIEIRYSQPKRLSNRWQRRRAVAAALILLVIGLGGATYFGSQLSKPRSLEPVSAVALPAPTVKQSPAPTTTLPRSEPIRVRIPRLGINTGLVTLGRQSDGTMEVPATPDVAGWYKYAPTPGESGPSIIVGHVDSVHGPAVFWRLRELQPGDQVEVDRADGKTIKFIINKVEQFSKHNFPTQEVYGNIDHVGIRLITCGGVFDRQIHDYTDNTVVFGSLVT